jgi:hypothetical protein
MLNKTLVSLLFLLGAVLPLQAQACRTLSVAEVEEGSGTIVNFMEHTQFAGIRQANHVPVVDPAHIRVLSDAQDATVCQTLRARVRNQELLSSAWVEVLFEVDGYYFQVFLKAPVEHTRMHSEGDRLVGENYMVPFSMFRSDLSVVFMGLI